MSSVKCSQCGLINWASEEKCKRCSNLLNSPSVPNPHVPIAHRGESKPASISAACPQCHSENTQSFEMVYSSGTSKGSITAFSFDVDTGAVMSTGGALSRQSDLAASVTPPSPPLMGANQIIVKGLLACLIAVVLVPVTWWATNLFLSRDLATFISAALAVILIIAGIGWGAYIESERHARNMENFRRGELAEWQRSWICLRCGHRWKR
jgi:uncharacterized membrane protein